MQSSNIPTKIPLPFAYGAGGGYINTIPATSQIGITNGKASLVDGFPPLTFTPITAGGVPPFGSDMNGILNEITAIQQWQEAGGFFPFDATFATTIGGYPKGAILQSSTQAGLWVSTIENNTNNPDTTGTGWTSFAFEGTQAITISGTTTALTNLQSAYPVLVVSGTLTANSTITIPAQVGEWIVVNNTGGAYTLTFRTVSGTGVTVAQGYSTYTYGDGTNIYLANSAAVTSFNGRTGSISLNATDVTSALGYTPYNATNPTGFTGWVIHNSSTTVGIGSSYTLASNTLLVQGYVYAPVVTASHSSINIYVGASLIQSVQIGFEVGANNGNGYWGWLPFNVAVPLNATSLTFTSVNGTAATMYVTGYVTSV
jgi:hypothetical protein